MAITVVVAVATVVLSLREDIFLPRALMLVVMMIGGNNSMLDLAAWQADTQVLVTMISLLRVLIVALAAATILDFILRQRLPMLYTRRSKRMQNHVILCGLGQVGYRVALELQKFDTEITVIEQNPAGPYVRAVTDEGIPILFEDARNRDVLTYSALQLSSLTGQSVWDLWGKYDVNTLSFTSTAGVVTKHSGPTATVPPNSKIAVVGPYDQIQLLPADHGIIDATARVRHSNTPSS